MDGNGELKLLGKFKKKNIYFFFLGGGGVGRGGGVVGGGPIRGWVWGGKG